MELECLHLPNFRELGSLDELNFAVETSNTKALIVLILDEMKLLIYCKELEE